MDLRATAFIGKDKYSHREVAVESLRLLIVLELARIGTTIVSKLGLLVLGVQH